MEKSTIMETFLKTKRIKIGEGGYGSIYKINVNIAIKQCTEGLQSFLREGAIMKACKHPFIMSAEFIDINHKLIGMELATQNLEEYLKNSELHVPVNKWMKQLFAAVEFLHKNKIIHRDVRPSNILVMNDSNIKLADFSISKICCDTHPYTVEHSLGDGYNSYMSPEMIRSSSTITNMIDVWGAAVSCIDIYHKDIIMNQLLGCYNKEPAVGRSHIVEYFGNEDEIKQSGCVVAIDRRREKIGYPGPCLRSVKKENLPEGIRKALRIYPADRISAHEVYNLLCVGKSPDYNLGTFNTLMDKIIRNPINRHPDIVWRQILIAYDWMFDVFYEKNMYHRGILLSIIMFQLYFDMVEKVLTFKDIQLVICGAIMLGSNMFHGYPLGYSTMSYLTDNAFTSSEIKNMTLEMYDIVGCNCTINLPNWEIDQSIYTCGELLLCCKFSDITYWELLSIMDDVEKDDLSWGLLKIVFEEELFSRKPSDFDAVKKYIYK